MDKKQVADILEEMGTLLEIKGANPFRSRAFHNASANLASVPEDLRELSKEDRLTEIPGIGKGIAEIIRDLLEKGASKEYDDLKQSLPPGLPEITRISGLGPKRVKLLYEKLSIGSVAELEEAATTHRLSDLAGFGSKMEENILKGIERLRRSKEKFHVNVALEAAERVLHVLRKLKQVQRAEIAGSLRRRKEIIGDIDIVTSSLKRDRNRIIETFVNLPDVIEVVARGETKASVRLKAGISCDLRVVSDKEYPFALNYFTGSKEHNVEIRTLARTKGLSLNEYEFSPIEMSGTKSVRVSRCRDEKDIYAALGLAFIAPELRENNGEIEAAKQSRLPKLIENSDLQGTFHCHTVFSDGVNTVEEMTAAAQKLGWKYWGVADHSGRAIYAHGMSEERIREQHALIDRLNETSRAVRIFKGIECDILPDGSLDLPAKVLSGFEYVVASIHSVLSMSEKDATARIIKALKNKYVSIVGHPTGRLLLSRDGYPLNMNEILSVSSDYGKVLEINAHPYRLDLDWRLVRAAKERGVKLSINPDAHNIGGLKDVQFGVGIARKGWLERSDVINAWSIEEVEKFFKKQRG